LVVSSLFGHYGKGGESQSRDEGSHDDCQWVKRYTVGEIDTASGDIRWKDVSSLTVERAVHVDFVRISAV